MLDIVKNPNPLPDDPMYGVEYAYSILNTGKEYQLAGILENPHSFAADSRSIISSESAMADPNLRTASSYVLGSYNRLVTKVKKSGSTYVLAIPSIIASDLADVTVEGMIASS